MDARIALGLLTSLAAVPLAHAQGTAPRALADVLAAARDAAGPAPVEPIRARGSATRMEAEGDLVLDLLPDGRFRLAVGGPLPSVQASDGDVWWESDWTGMAGPLEMADRERIELVIAVLSVRWLREDGGCVVALAPSDAQARAESEAPAGGGGAAGRGAGTGDESGAGAGARERRSPERSGPTSGAGGDAERGGEEGGGVAPSAGRGGAAADGIALTLRLADGLLTAELVLDAETHLARSLAFARSTWRFEDHRAPLGFAFPHRIRIVERSGTESVDRIATLERTDGPPADALRMPAVPPDDHALDAGASPVVTSKRVKSGHLLVHPRLDGRDVGWFILDSGAGAMCITPALADELGLATVGTVTAAGIGGSVPARIRRGGELVVGPLVMRAPTWVELDLAFLEEHFGVPVAGILGHDLFARAVVSIDAVTPRVEIHAPAAHALPAGGSWARLAIDDRLPCVEARFEGDRTATFRIDTGANGTLSFQADAVERWGLLEGRETRTTLTGGVGGFVQVPSGELEWFELGGRRLAPVAGVTFEREPGPLALPPHVAGTIGGGLLEPFTMVLDYRGRRVAFLPRGE